MSEYFPYRIIVASIPQFIIQVSPRRFFAEALMFELAIPLFLNAPYVLCSATAPSSNRTSISLYPPYRMIVAFIPQFITRVSPTLSIFATISYPSLFAFVLTLYMSEYPKYLFLPYSKKDTSFRQCLNLLDALPSLF